MIPAQWDGHKHAWCESCKYARGCVVKAVLDKDSNDSMALTVIRRLGHCSQYEYKQPRKTKRKVVN